jgi:hypothetical protein
MSLIEQASITKCCCSTMVRPMEQRLSSVAGCKIVWMDGLPRSGMQTGDTGRPAWRATARPVSAVRRGSSKLIRTANATLPIFARCGHRTERLDGWQRVLASRLVRAVVRMATGARCVDANVPYRLMTTHGLLPLVDSVPSSFALANIALAVQLQRASWREAQVPIVFRPRAGGEPTVPLTRFAEKALELIYQLLLLPRPVSPVRK